MTWETEPLAFLTEKKKKNQHKLLIHKAAETDFFTYIVDTIV